MYRYDEFDSQYVRDRVATFRQQIDQRRKGILTEDEFKPLRLQNGMYLQLHAYMLRVAVPYGTMNSRQLHQLAMIAEKWDRGYGHFTTRQNIQFNWPTLDNVADILDSLADVGMHAIQTSGNCIRNITADHFAGAAADEIADPRPVAEMLRQWSTDHPEFSFLPRKFKIAVTGSPNDRAVTLAHDIGLRIKSVESGEPMYQVSVGGGLGRTPNVGVVLADAIGETRLLPYLEAIMRVYNLHGRRDNKYKARIKILVKSMGIDAFRHAVEAEFELLMKDESTSVTYFDQNSVKHSMQHIRNYFSQPDYINDPIDAVAIARQAQNDAGFKAWFRHNLTEHHHPDYVIATISLKAPGKPPGDASAEQMRVVAQLAERYSHDELRVSHEQNLILPHVHRNNLYAVYKALASAGLGTANAGLISDIIACPGLDYCSLATARSIPLAQDISRHFADPYKATEIGSLKIKISGCINACAHHHVGNIGILGLEKNGKEYYQFTLGGDHTEAMKLGKRAGPGIAADDVIPALDRVVSKYLDVRLNPDETFIETCARVGVDDYELALYQNDGQPSHNTN